MDLKSQVNHLSDAVEEKIIGYRRDFHKYAESAWTEFRTSSLIAQRLEELGYEVHVGREIIKESDRMGLPSDEELEAHYQRALAQGANVKYAEKMRGGFTGAVGILRNGDGPVIGMRFDIDAVDMDESKDPNHRPTKEGFASVNPKAMHSCGHDGHASIGLGVAEVLMQLKDQIKGTIKLVFQPAEEGVRGAKAIVGAGVVDDVNFMLGSHLGSGTETGIITCGRGNFLATDKFDAFITGAPAHAGGAPQKGKNALVAAATAVLNLYAIPRHSDGPTRVNIGRLNAGTGRNVIAPSAHLAVETRGQTTELSKYMYDYAIRVLKTAAEMHDCKLEIKAMGGAQSGDSDQALAERVAKAANELGCYKTVSLERQKGGGSEDYTYMMTRVQQNGGLATFMGIGADLGGWAHHVAEFDFDEKALAGGVKLFVMTALNIINE